MKVVQQVNEKPKYVPITITLETAEEFMEFYAIVNHNADNRKVVGWVLDDFGGHLYDSPNLSNTLYNQLKKYKQQVKETL